MVYMNSTRGTELLQHFSTLFSNAHVSAMWATYEMLYNNGDAFGRTMRDNLKRRNGLQIPGFLDFPTLESQEKRFVDAGWTAAKSCTMLSFYNRYGFG